MVGFKKIALLSSHPRVPLTQDYYVSDLIELCGLAAVVRDQVAEVSIPVNPTDRDPLGAFERFMKKRRPDLVGISCFTCSANSAFEYARIAKEYGAFVLTGGYHPSALPEEMLQSESIDAVVRGEGEETFREVVGGSSVETVAGLSFKMGGKIVHNPDRPLIEDLDALPLPLREIRPPRFGLAGADYHVDTIYTSRGCRGKCTFCANHLVGKTWRRRSAEGVLEELLTITPPRGRGLKPVKFWDPCFLTDADYVEELCDLILEHGLQRHFRFIGETRAADIVRGREILPKMKRAGFARVGCGIESPNLATHKLLRKGLNLNHVEQAADLLADAGILFSKFLIVGHENEGEADILKYPDYALSLGVENQNTTFFIMTPYPGTDLGASYSEKGMITNTDWDLYTNFGAVIAPGDLTSRRLQVLSCSVAAKYALFRRFRQGASFANSVARLFEVLFIHAKLMLLDRGISTADAEQGLWQALEVFVGSVDERPSKIEGKGRSSKGLAVWFHARDRAPIKIVLWRDEETDHLLVRMGEEADSAEFPEARTYHLSLGRMTRLVGDADYQKMVHDVMTLKINAKAFKLAWIPSAAWGAFRAAIGLAGITAFHLARKLRFDSS